MRVGMEASGHAEWFERLLAELNFELWMGDAAKRLLFAYSDRQDALQLMVKDDFPAMPNKGSRAISPTIIPRNLDPRLSFNRP